MGPRGRYAVGCTKIGRMLMAFKAAVLTHWVLLLCGIKPRLAAALSIAVLAIMHYRKELTCIVASL